MLAALPRAVGQPCDQFACHGEGEGEGEGETEDEAEDEAEAEVEDEGLVFVTRAHARALPVAICETWMAPGSG